MKLFLNEPIFFHLIHSFKLYFGFRDGTRRKWDFFFVFIPCRLIALENYWIAASGKRGSSLWSRNTRPDIIRNDDSLSFHHHIVISIYSNLNLFVVWNWKISELDVYISMTHHWTRSFLPRDTQTKTTLEWHLHRVKRFPQLTYVHSPP